MQTSVMIGVAVSGMLVLLGIAIVMQRIEENRRLRARRVRDTILRLRKYWAALTEMPEGSLPPNLQMVLVQRMTQEMKVLRQLNPAAPEVGQYHSLLQERVPRIKSAPAEPAKLDLSDPQKTRALRARMRALHMLIQGLSDARMIDANTTGQFNVHINQLNGETLIALYTQQARDACQDLKPAVAMHQITLCINELEKINQRGNWNARLLELRGMLDNLSRFGALTEEEAAAVEQIRTERAAAAEAAGQDGALGEALDEMLAAEHAWKKKAQYD